MKKSKISFSDQLQPLLRFVSRYKKFLFIVTILGIMTFLVFRINQFSNQEPSESVIDEKLQTVARPKFDQNILDRLQQLQDQNVDVRSLFDQARNNPFNE